MSGDIYPSSNPWNESLVQHNSGNDLDYTISSFSSARYGAVACARGWSLVTKGAYRPCSQFDTRHSMFDRAISPTHTQKNHLITPCETEMIIFPDWEIGTLINFA